MQTWADCESSLFCMCHSSPPSVCLSLSFPCFCLVSFHIFFSRLPCFSLVYFCSSVSISASFNLPPPLHLSFCSVIPSVSLSFHVSLPFFHSASFAHPNFLLHIPPSVCLSLSVSLLHLFSYSPSSSVHASVYSGLIFFLYVSFCFSV